jgi:hypothetical protein
MTTVTLEQVQDETRKLPPDKLAAVARFISSLADEAGPDDADVAMKLSEDALRRLWDTPEEDKAWAHL